MSVTPNKIKMSKNDYLYYIIIYIVTTFVFLIIAYPLIYILSSSFSSANAVVAGRVRLFPVDFSIEGYKEVFKNPDILNSYKNTFFYTFVGTIINLVVTLFAAYPLSRKDLVGRNYFMLLFSFTMIFSGGLIPTYILMKDLNIINTRYALIIPGALSVYNMIITRTFMQNSIPVELLEASQIDGCSDARYFFQIALPLSKAVIAVITLFYAVGHWNAYFNAFLYLSNRKLFPLQTILREILLSNSMDASASLDPELASLKQGMADLLKYSLIIVASVPILFLYPFVQKYFTKGVMIGSVKG